ncbi:hypothetical protein M569_01320, partial [Genlisea aurea]
LNKNSWDSMNEEMGDGVAEAVENSCIRNKEDVLCGNPNTNKSDEMVIPGLNNYSESSKNLRNNADDEKDLCRIDSSAQASASPRCADDAGIMVEELTLRRY